MHSYRKTIPNRTRSYWLGASNYYVMTMAVALAVFFMVMWLLRDGNDEAFIPAGVSASAVIVSAVIVRRAIIRNHQVRNQAARRLESNLVALRAPGMVTEKKLTIEQNASILKELKRKSDAAVVLGKYPEGHREVFQLCGQYLDINEREMQTVNPGSPRIAALRRGREIAEDYHRRHMLKWAEIETTSLLADAHSAAKSAEKVELAGRALAIIGSASLNYPSDRKLKESAAAIGDFIVSVRVKGLIQRAATAESKGNVKLAAKHFKGALAELNKSSDGNIDKDDAVQKIKVELERLANSELQ
jgi:hypothetical protein